MSEEPSERRDWTDEELDLIVADYFLMLDDEAAGVAFNKAQHNRLLRSKIDRSESSIEFKHQNVSAVLQQLGLPRIRGYMPAANYQRAIIPAIDRYLSRNPVALYPEKALSGFAERPGLFVETPPLLPPVIPRQKISSVWFGSLIPSSEIFETANLGAMAKNWSSNLSGKDSNGSIGSCEEDPMDLRGGWRRSWL
jgi:hypothetical protein